MGYVRLTCDHESSHQFYAHERDSYKDRCPMCEGALERGRRVAKHRPKRLGGKERYEVPHINSSTLNRPRRIGTIQGVEKFRSKRRDYDLKLRRGLMKLGVPEEELDEDDVAEFELGEDDLLYVPGEAFKPSMRFTDSSGPRYKDGERDLSKVTTDPTYRKIMSDSVKGSAVRGNANAKMGGSAYDAATAAGHKAVQRKNDPYRGDHYEWNHLIADCLGGPTEPKNLIAASAACNSYMLNIEACLRGKTHIYVTVTAFCKVKDVAEWIRYEIINKGKALSKDIDATNPYFTREDGKELRAQVLNFCKKK